MKDIMRVYNCEHLNTTALTQSLFQHTICRTTKYRLNHYVLRHFIQITFQKYHPQSLELKFYFLCNPKWWLKKRITSKCSTVHYSLS